MIVQLVQQFNCSIYKSNSIFKRVTISLGERRLILKLIIKLLLIQSKFYVYFILLYLYLYGYY